MPHITCCQTELQKKKLDCTGSDVYSLHEKPATSHLLLIDHLITSKMIRFVSSFVFYPLSLSISVKHRTWTEDIN